MNLSDSKKLEEIEKQLEGWNISYTDYHPFKKGLYENIFMEDAESDVTWLLSKVKEQDQEIECLLELERIAKQLVGEWNEFEQPIALEWDMPDPMRTIYEWASEWYSYAKQAKDHITEQDEDIVAYQRQALDREMWRATAEKAEAELARKEKEK